VAGGTADILVYVADRLRKLKGRPMKGKASVASSSHGLTRRPSRSLATGWGDAITLGKSPNMGERT